MITNQKQIRAEFWKTHPELDLEARRNKTRFSVQNHQTNGCRLAFCNFVDTLAKCGDISESLAFRATL